MMERKCSPFTVRADEKCYFEVLLLLKCAQRKLDIAGTTTEMYLLLF